ncbi:MAG: hypothetical protein LBE91_17535 [Tannerella sp.]|jgi:predicted transcriptional regulator|nr:hypothetical protein [Tannerella sp.]
MTVVNTEEFNANQKKYFDMAVNEQIFIKRGKNIFIITRVEDDEEEEEDDELELAKERKNSDGKFMETADFIRYLRK